MAVHLSGLSSGLDTEAIVAELVSAQALKKTKVENKLTKLEWKEEKWKELNKKIYALYTEELSKFKTQGSYLTKGVTSTDPSKAKFTATTHVPAGTHTVEIKSVASSQYVTGAMIDKTGVSKSTTLSSLGVKEGTVFTLTINPNGKDAKTSYFEVTGSKTIGDLTEWAKESNVNLTFDSNNNRFFISSKESGLENSFSLTSATAGEQTQTSLATVKEAIGYNLLTKNQQQEVNAALNTISNGPSAANYTEAVQKIQTYAATYKAVSQNDEVIKTIRESADYTSYVDKYVSSSLDKIEVEKVDGVYTVKGFKDGSAMTDEELKKHQAGLDQAMKDAFETACKNSTSKYQAKFKEEFSNHKDASEQTITDAIEQYRNSFGGTKSALEELGIGEINLDSDGKLLGTNLPGSSFVNASDCTVIYNGAEFKNSTNSITVNGLTIQAHEVTTQPLKVTVNNDTQTVYNTVKNFTKKYNEVLKELTDLYYADAAKGYDVLTDEEKKVMSADQIEKWENKIKGSLLRRDSTLAGLISTMQSITTMSVTVDGKKYTLADFGIGTFDYTEKGLLHIDGDSDDPSTSDKKDRLMIALNENPDLVMQVLSGIGSQLYSELGNKMSATKSSSALTFYNDKEIKSMKTEHKDEIKKWETKLADLEKKWYSKFAKMESSLAKLNAQTSYISSLFTSGL